MYHGYDTKFEVLIGKTLKSISVRKGNDEIVFLLDNNTEYKMYHSQDCCESVKIEDISGDLEDLLYSPITMAEVSISHEPSEDQKEFYNDSCTWTFYKLATVKGYVTIRWYGSSNGYYSESVDFMEMR